MHCSLVCVCVCVGPGISLSVGHKPEPGSMIQVLCIYIYDGYNCTQEMQNLILEHVKWDSIPLNTGFEMILYSCISFLGWPICWVGDVTWV